MILENFYTVRRLGYEKKGGMSYLEDLNVCDSAGLALTLCWQYEGTGCQSNDLEDDSRRELHFWKALYVVERRPGK